MLLSTPAVDILVTFTSQQLVAKGYHRTNAGEMIQFLATKFLRSRINTSPEIAWRDYLEPLARNFRIKLMEMTRFNTMLNNISGYAVCGRSGDHEDIWMQRNNLLRKLNQLEIEIFKPSVEILLNKKWNNCC